MATKSAGHKEASNCCAGCRFIRSETKNGEKPLVGDEKAQEALVAEKAFDSTVSRIKGSLSWASSGLLDLAVSSTIVVAFGEDQWQVVLADWVYVIILVLIEVVLQTVTIDAVDAPDAIGKELDATVPKKKAARGDEVAKHDIETKKERQARRKIDRSNEGIAARILRFAEKRVDKFFDNMANLGTAILANVVAVAVNSAVVATFKWIVESDDLTLALQWGYSMLVTVVTMYVALRSGKKIDNREIELYDLVYKNAADHGIRRRGEIWTQEEIYDDVVRFAAYRRFISLVNYTLGLTMAWAWQGSLKATIIEAYTGDDDSDTTSESLSGLWIYLAVATAVVAYFNSLSEKYYFLYPRDEQSGMQMETKEREFIGNAIYKNAQTVVGIAWYDAMVESCDVAFDGSEQVAAIWVTFIVLQAASILGEYYWQSLWLRFEMIERGVVTAIYKAFDDLWDRNAVLENDQEEKEKAKKSHDFWVLYVKEIIELTVVALGIGAGWTGPAAVKSVLVEIYGGTFDPDTTDDVDDDVLWSAWLAFVIALVVSTGIMYFLSGLQKAKKQARRKEMKKIAKVEDKGDDQDDENEKDKDDDGDDGKSKELELIEQGGKSQSAANDAAAKDTSGDVVEEGGN